MIEVNCQCGSRFRLEDEWAGRQARCPVCRNVLRVSDSVVADRSAPFAPPTEPAAPTTSPTILPAPPLGSAPRPAPTPSQPRPATSELDRFIRPALIATSGLAIVVLSGLAVYALVTSGGSNARVASSVEPPESDYLPPEDPGELPAATFEQDVVERTESDVPLNAASPRDSSAAKPRPEAASSPPGPAATGADPREPTPDPAIAAQSTGSAANLSKQPPRERSPGRGLSGVSREYDDFHCQRIQQQFGWRVPAAAEFLEVNGERLAITNLEALRQAPAPYLFLPRGEHAIRLRSGEQPLRTEVGEHLVATYAEMRSFFGVEAGVRTDELLARGARAMDVHSTPFLLNLTGASYVAESQWGAAERKFRRALAVNPLFAPAHLNLAVCRARVDDAEGAAREVRLANALNVGNVFGLAAAITQVRRELALPDNDDVVVPLDVDQYVSPEPLTEEDHRLAALMTAMSKYAVAQEDRGKILNNVAVHFADTGKTETALEHFRAALGAIKFAGAQRFSLAGQVFSHMESACRKSGFPEADEYAFMRESVMP